MIYKATFGIDCGVSPGFGVKSPDYVRRTDEISADNTESALQGAMGLARKFADDYLSNPDTGLTTVQLLSLTSPTESVSFDASKAIITRSMFQHLAAFLSAS